MARKCRHCKTELPPAKQCASAYQRGGFCDVECMASHGIAKAKHTQEKARKKATQARREKIKTLSDHLREAQQAFNAWIRERDRDEPCISCQRYHSGQYHAGHYRSVGACSSLRFDPSNLAKQCQPCNAHLSGNVIEYRKNLLIKLGAAELERIETDDPMRKWTIDEAKAIKKKYRQALREMLK